MTPPPAPPGGPRVIVVGAGISGLSAAWRLHEVGVRVTVLESAATAGGKMAASRAHGFGLSHGAAVLTTTYREFTRLARDVGVGSALTPLHAVAGVIRDGRIHRVRAAGPAAIWDGLRTGLLSPRSKLLLTRLMLDALRARRYLALDDHAGRAERDTETVREYCDRRLNPEIRDHLVGPLVYGLYLTDAMNASVVDLFLTLTRMLGGRFYQVTDGVDFLARAIASRLDVRSGAPVREVRRTPDGVRVRWEDNGAPREEVVDGCVLAVPAPVVPTVYPDLDPAIRTIITERLPQIDLISARFALRRPHPEPSYVIMAPRGHLDGLATVVQEHRRSPASVPPGKGLLVAFWAPEWCTAHLEVEDDALGAEMLETLERVLPGISELVEFVTINRWSPANPDVRAGNHHLYAELARRTDPADRIVLAGDYTGLPLIEGCVISGRDAARRLATTLVRTETTPPELRS